ncbi:MAG: hypothetical protein OEY91_13055 [Nitrospirota bacterium]|nr:hypothetical protein [Nitrospirota bacterium]
MSLATQEEHSFEQLTCLAMEAATQGKWDSVAQLYDRRANVGDLHSVSHEVATKLMQYDQWIMARIQDVKILVQHELRETEQHRRSLEGLKRQWAPLQPDHALHRLSI